MNPRLLLALLLGSTIALLVLGNVAPTSWSPVIGLWTSILSAPFSVALADLVKRQRGNGVDLSPGLNLVLEKLANTAPSVLSIFFADLVMIYLLNVILAVVTFSMNQMVSEKLIVFNGSGVVDFSRYISGSLVIGMWLPGSAVLGFWASRWSRRATFFHFVLGAAMALITYYLTSGGGGPGFGSQSQRGHATVELHLDALTGQFARIALILGAMAIVPWVVMKCSQGLASVWASLAKSSVSA